MAQMIGAKDWSSTLLGPPENWSAALRMMVNFMIPNRFPMLLWWGPEYISIYNDAYAPILGAKHSWALGRPFKEVWSEISHILLPLIDAPFRGGASTWMEDIPLEIKRHGWTEETHFTIAYSPVPDEDAPGGIGGVLATVHEITEKVVGERRLATLRDLAARASEARSVERACAVAIDVLKRKGSDIPFALLYLMDKDGDEAHLAASAGFEKDHPAAPPVIAINDEKASWPLAKALYDDALVRVDPDLGPIRPIQPL